MTTGFGDGTGGVIPPYPHDGGLIERVDWLFAYGPMLAVTLGVAVVLDGLRGLYRRLRG